MKRQLISAALAALSFAAFAAGGNLRYSIQVNKFDKDMKKIGRRP